MDRSGLVPEYQKVAGNSLLGRLRLCGMRQCSVNGSKSPFRTAKAKTHVLMLCPATSTDIVFNLRLNLQRFAVMASLSEVRLIRFNSSCDQVLELVCRSILSQRSSKFGWYFPTRSREFKMEARSSATTSPLATCCLRETARPTGQLRKLTKGMTTSFVNFPTRVGLRRPGRC